MNSYVVRFLGVSALLCSFAPTVAASQARSTPGPHPRWEIPGFDFRKDGVWRVKARNVRAARRSMMSASGTQLSIQSSATVVSGVLKVPAILFRFKDSPPQTYQPADYNDVLFGATPTGAAAGRPFTYRSYYSQLSNGLLDIQGTTTIYANLDSNEVWYNGGTSSTCAGNNPYGSQNCNGLFSSTAQTRMQNGLREALSKIDATVNFADYVDASGFVPLVLFIFQAAGGECGPANAPENHLWAHRFSLGTYATQDNDPGHAGQKVKISDYILQSGLGGLNSCTPQQIMPIGTVAHETGHGFGLPDLYDTGPGSTEGAGQWDIMSSGSFTTGFSPARMSAWSLNELGWITIRQLTTTGTYTFDAAPLSDTAFMVRVQGSNPRGEYYLLENRQRQQADTALIRIHCQRAGAPSNCPGGLLIWHVDSAKIAQSFSNDVNDGAIHGVAVVQADSFGNLDAPAVNGNFCPSTSITFGCSNRGDAGDLFPGATNNTRGLVFKTNPAALKNLDASFAGFAVDSVKQLVADRTLSVRVRFGALTVARASDPNASIQFAGSTYTLFRDLLEDGQGYAVNFTDPQTSADGRRRFHFASWSDGGAQSHSYTGRLAGDTLIANVTRDFKLRATSNAGGSLSADTAIDLNGTFIAEGRAVTLTATPDAGMNFLGWSGDASSASPTLVLPMDRPYTVSACFGGTVAISSPDVRDGVMGATYADTIRVSGACSATWTISSGSLPAGLTLNASTGEIAGAPRVTGDFSFTVTVTVSAQSDSKAFTLSVTAPTLTTNNVLLQLFGTGSPLSADEQRYLDFLGNNNGSFDVGDFLAWVKATGAPASPAVPQSQPRRKGGSQ